jgi:hypothetical protein
MKEEDRDSRNWHCGSCSGVVRRAPSKNMGALAPNYKQKQCDNNDALRYRKSWRNQGRRKKEEERTIINGAFKPAINYKPETLPRREVGGESTMSVSVPVPPSLAFPFMGSEGTLYGVGFRPAKLCP